jgi:hypothetical protein
MPKKLIKAKAPVADKKLVKKIIEEDDDVTPEGEQAEELDPEVLEALTAKKVKKVKVNHPIDYIPELERDESDFDLA